MLVGDAVRTSRDSSISSTPPTLGSIHRMRLKSSQEEALESLNGRLSLFLHVVEHFR